MDIDSEYCRFIPVAIIFKGVVGPQGRQGTSSDAVGEEDLRRAIDPRPWCQQSLPDWCHIVPETDTGALQRYGTNQQHGQDEVGEERREPDDLSHTNHFKSIM